MTAPRTRVLAMILFLIKVLAITVLISSYLKICIQSKFSALKIKEWKKKFVSIQPKLSTKLKISACNTQLTNQGVSLTWSFLTWGMQASKVT